MILITGCAGYIGSQLSYIFKKKKLNFIGLDNLEYSYRKNYPLKKNFFKLDISSNQINNLIKQHKIKTVIHCAALSYVMDAENNKQKYNLNNIVKTKKFINMCKNNGVANFIFFSSSNVYRNTGQIFSENTFRKPINTYGKNKLKIENYVMKKNFSSSVVLRLFNIVGVINKFYIFKPKKKYQRFFFRLIEKNFRPTIKFYIRKNVIHYPKRDFLDIADLNGLILKIIRKLKKREIKSIFNVGSGKDHSILDLYYKFNQKIKIKKPIYKTLSKKELKKTRANNSKTMNYFNWKPIVSLERSIKSTIKLAKI